MVPETADTGSLRLFRARRFPHEWELETVMLSGFPMVDSTLFEPDGQWFLFVDVDERGGGFNDELFLFTANSPLGPWHPHPDNPIKSDVRSARPAGRLFYHQGRLIRPSQDCSTDYGAAINLCEIEVLSDTEYRERVVGRIEADCQAGLTGCHTINSTKRVEVTDGRRNIWR